MKNSNNSLHNDYAMHNTNDNQSNNDNENNNNNGANQTTKNNQIKYKIEDRTHRTQNGVYKTHSVGQAIQKTLAKKLSKEEYLTIKLICDWHLIAPKIHQISKPLRVYLDQEMLVLATQPGYSMTLQYQNDEICWSVNKYLNSQQITRLLIKTDFYYNK